MKAPAIYKNDTKKMLIVNDSVGRAVSISDSVKHVICSGSGALRLLTYL